MQAVRIRIRFAEMSKDILNLPSYRVNRLEETEHDYHVYAETVTPSSGVCVRVY